MKLLLDLMNQIPVLLQCEAVDAYIKKNSNIKSIPPFNILEIFTGNDYEQLTIKPTKKNTGERIELSSGKAFHVSCRQNKFESYSFRVWQAV